MRHHKTSFALAAIAVCGSLPLAAEAQWRKALPPTLAFEAPEAGGALRSGVIQGPPDCTVTGTSLARVAFYLDDTWLNSDGNASNGFGCWLDTRNFVDGAYTLKAIGYNSSGQSVTVTHPVRIGNAPASGTAPTLSFQSPAPGGTLKSGVIQGPPDCTVTGSNLARVMFYLDGTWLNTDGNAANGFGCWLDTRNFADGSYTLKALAYNAAGESATVEHPVVITNASSPANQPPTVGFKAPSSGQTLSGAISQSSACEVLAADDKGVKQVQFFLGSTALNTEGSAPWNCDIDTRKFADGTHTLKAVATDGDGASATAQISINIKNAVASTAPSLVFQAPAAGGTLKSGVIQGPPECTVTGTNLARVMFYLNGAWLNTDGNAANGFGCWLDTRNFADGAYTLKAVAYNAAGQSTSVDHPVVIKNGSGSDDSGGSGGAVDASDVMQVALAGVPFAEQRGYNAQVIGTYPSVSSIPESGIHYSTLSNGETLRLGKENDPAGSGKKAIAFQLAPGDPVTSGSRRAEIRFGDNIEHNKVYWVAFRMYVRDWGTLSSSDAAVFGTQLHSGDNSRGLSPSFSLVTYGGRSFQVYALHSTSSSPSQGNTVTAKSSNIAIPFGRWVDMVFKFRQDTSGSGFLQAWMDGEQIMNYQGRLGFNTPGYKDYMKFGYYNWSSFSSPRKVMLRSVSQVLDPTGSKYRLEDLRALINQ